MKAAPIMMTGMARADIFPPYQFQSQSDGLRSVLMQILPKIHIHKRPRIMNCVVNHCTPPNSQILMDIGSTETEIYFFYDASFDEKVLSLRVETMKFKYEELNSLSVIRKLIEEWVSGSRNIKMFKIYKLFGCTPWMIEISEWEEIVEKFRPFEVEKLTKYDVRFKIARTCDERILDVKFLIKYLNVAELCLSEE